jgi:hypothetical protein
VLRKGVGVADKKIKANVPGVGDALDAIEVPISDTTERWTEVTLEDGSVIRVKPVVIAAARVEGKYDQEGNPIYSLRLSQVMVVASVPERLRKNAATDTTKH